MKLWPLFFLPFMYHCFGGGSEIPIAPSSSLQPSHTFRDSIAFTSLLDSLITPLDADTMHPFHQEYQEFAKTNSGLSSSNKQDWYRLRVAHALLTSSGAYNAAVGPCLRVPYMWHWVSPNPRHEIIVLKTGKTMKETKSPAGFGKYASYADVDRTPTLFVTEWVSAEPLFQYDGLGTFQTFGWCSEREMAFSCWMRCLGLQAKIITQGNHCWTEIKWKIRTSSGERTCIVHIDNTFDVFRVETSDLSIKNWDGYKAPGNKAAWYNTQVELPAHQQALKKLRVSPITAQQWMDSLYGLNN